MKTTKAITFIFSFLLFLATAKGQSNKVPPFRMMQPNGKIFNATDLPVGKPIIIIYFLPDCDHCQKLTKELTDNIDWFHKASIVMITYKPLKDVSKFVVKYKLNRNQNLYVGTEGNTLFVRDYYQIEHMPFVALYTKNGNLVKTFLQEPKLKDVQTLLNKL